MKDYSEYIQRKQREYGDRFDASDLDSRFVKAWETGQRIRVRVAGEVRTGTVGVTTGWKPVFLLMLTSRSFGSHIFLDKSAAFTTDKVTRYCTVSK